MTLNPASTRSADLAMRNVVNLVQLIIKCCYWEAHYFSMFGKALCCIHLSPFKTCVQSKIYKKLIRTLVTPVFTAEVLKRENGGNKVEGCHTC